MVCCTVVVSNKVHFKYCALSVGFEDVYFALMRTYQFYCTTLEIHIIHSTVLHFWKGSKVKVLLVCFVNRTVGGVVQL